MKLFNIARRFVMDESGAVTVDWVVLTAAIVGLATAIILLVQGGAQDLAGDISGALVAMTVNT
jgi:Flp pilus assembly pilin Flp